MYRQYRSYIWLPAHCTASQSPRGVECLAKHTGSGRVGRVFHSKKVVGSANHILISIWMKGNFDVLLSYFVFRVHFIFHLDGQGILAPLLNTSHLPRSKTCTKVGHLIHLLIRYHRTSYNHTLQLLHHATSILHQNRRTHISQNITNTLSCYAFVAPDTVVRLVSSTDIRSTQQISTSNALNKARWLPNPRWSPMIHSHASRVESWQSLRSCNLPGTPVAPGAEIILSTRAGCWSDIAAVACYLML